MVKNAILKNFVLFHTLFTSKDVLDAILVTLLTLSHMQMLFYTHTYGFLKTPFIVESIQDTIKISKEIVICVWFTRRG